MWSQSTPSKKGCDRKSDMPFCPILQDDTVNEYMHQQCLLSGSARIRIKKGRRDPDCYRTKGIETLTKISSSTGTTLKFTYFHYFLT